MKTATYMARDDHVTHYVRQEHLTLARDPNSTQNSRRRCGRDDEWLNGTQRSTLPPTASAVTRLTGSCPPHCTPSR